MKDQQNSNPPAGLFEPAVIGPDVSRTSQLIFILLCAIAAITTALFGGVDNGTWVLITAMAGAICMFWIADFTSFICKNNLSTFFKCFFSLFFEA